ncbi:AAA family ATPase [Natranaerofaba carboxydovora]|uniref:AAA family ATPase n=1 Tax=Natranaerofaba carboxydovora TaxID=2742683 RepID=UPI001F1432F3|nr:AAA family ATPase [Natranaerofaba carboxydovora]UMZ73794.1 AAA domain protein [Natranaerofaba carboxydovora]
MIINEVFLEQFGGVQNSKVELSKGLNVCYGLNESGKSTHINAIFASLFFPSNLRKNSSEYKDFIKPYFPIIGNNIEENLKVNLSFECSFEKKKYTLVKCWGREKSCSLYLPDGKVLSDENRINEKLKKSLQYGKATYEAVMFTKQTEVLNTLERLSNNSEAVFDVGYILRSMVFESGGVSIDDFKYELEKELDSLLKYWDYERDRPQNNRGIDNPYKNPGELLKAFYQLENIKRDIKQARKIELELERVNVEYKDLETKIGQLKQKINDLEQIEDDIRSRASVSPKLEAVNKELESIKEVTRTWPVVEDELERKQKEHNDNLNKISELEKEHKRALKIKDITEKQNLVEQVKPIKDELNQLKNKYEEYPDIKEKDIEILKSINTEMIKIKAQVEAVSLKGTFTTKEPTKIKIETGAGESSSVNVERSYEIKGKGRIKFVTDEWSIEIKSGEEDIDSLLNLLEENELEFKNKLTELKVEALEDAEKVYQQKIELTNKINNLEDKQKNLLGKNDFDTLSKELDESKALIQEKDESFEDPDIISEKINKLKIYNSSLKSKIDSLHEKINSWNETYGTFDNMTDRLGTLKSSEKELLEELEKLSPLPEDYKSEDEFFWDLKDSRNEYDKLTSKINEVKEEKIGLENELPEISLEELKMAEINAKEQYYKLKKKAKSLKIIQQELDKLIEEKDLNNFDSLEKSFSNYLPRVTNDRYEIGVLDGAKPQNVIREDGEKLPVEFLSAGTKSGISLAIRLSMAEYLLSEMYGFLIMDDPLVDLDPNRKEEASKMINDFANEKQIIITTCDPSTAELLGGNRIEF